MCLTGLLSALCSKGGNAYSISPQEAIVGGEADPLQLPSLWTELCGLRVSMGMEEEVSPVWG